MYGCTEGLSLEELLKRPTVELTLVGAEDPDDDEDDSDDEGEEEAGKDGKSKSGEDDKSKDKKAEPDAKDRLIVRLKDEKVTLRTQRDEAKAEVVQLKKDVITAKAEGVTDEDTKKRLGDLETQSTRDEETIHSLRIQVAFLSDNTNQWTNPAAALKLLDADAVEIDAKGKVTGLADALDDLVKAYPFLITPEKTEDGEDDEDAEKKPSRTGRTPSKKDTRDEKSKQAEASRFRQKYSGLRR